MDTPNFKDVAPEVSDDFKGFAGFNLLLGAALFFYQINFASSLPVLNQILSYQFWGVLFFTLGLAMAYAYWRNKVKYIRQLLFIALVFKMVWLAALIYRTLVFDYFNFILLILWLHLTYSQLIAYKRFPSILITGEEYARLK